VADNILFGLLTTVDPRARLSKEGVRIDAQNSWQLQSTVPDGQVPLVRSIALHFKTSAPTLYLSGYASNQYLIKVPTSGFYLIMTGLAVKYIQSMSADAETFFDVYLFSY
jgi:hypothetical protein